MSITESILEELVEEAVLVAEGTGIYVKDLGNRKVYTCKCPTCGTFHGGYKTFQEAQLNLLCRRCGRNAVEKKKKDIEKVDEPKKQKDIFKHPLNKPAMAEAMEEDDIPPQRRAVNLSDDIWSDENLLRRAFTWLTKIGVGPKFGSKPIGWYQADMMQAIDAIRAQCKARSVPPNWLRWSKGTIYGYQPETKRWVSLMRLSRTWGAEGIMEPINESFDDDQDLKELTTESPPGIVTKQVCMDAHVGQQFWHRTTGKAVRVSGKCKTWRTRPDEYRLPVKFGLFQTLSITERNADEFTTDPPADRRW